MFQFEIQDGGRMIGITHTGRWFPVGTYIEHDDPPNSFTRDVDRAAKELGVDRGVLENALIDFLSPRYWKESER